VGRAPLALVDQVLSSGSTFAFVYVGSLLLPVDEFGRLVLGMSVFYVLAAMLRGFVGEPMLAVLPGMAQERRSQAVRDAVRLGLLLGAAVWVAALIALPVVDGPSRELLWIAVWTPAALVQDIARYALLAVGRIGATLLLDLVWVGVQVLAFAAILLAGRPTVGAFALAWGFSAFCSAVLAVRLLPPRPWRGRALGWVRTGRSSAGWLTAGSVFGQAQQPLTLLVVASALGAEATGALRAIQLLALAAIQVVTAAAVIVLVPVFADPARRHDPRRRLVVLAFAIGGVLFAALLVLGRGPIVALLFPGFVAHTDLLVPMGLQAGVYLAIVPAVSLLRAAQRLAGLIVAQAVGIALSLAAVAAAAATGSLVAVAWAMGVAVAAWAGAAVLGAWSVRHPAARGRHAAPIHLDLSYSDPYRRR
jgi:hypothetical protein